MHKTKAGQGERVIAGKLEKKRSARVCVFVCVFVPVVVVVREQWLSTAYQWVA